MIGTWFGHARLLILLGILLLPFAFAASLITVPIEGGFGSDRSRPTSAAELSDEYRLVGGQIYLDLTRIEDTGEPIEISASVALGELNVFLPDDAGLELDAAVGGGQMRILGEFEEGTNLEARQVVDGDGPQFVLDLEAGLGTVQVVDPADGVPTAMTRHPADLISLTFGLLFVAIGVLLLFGRIDDLRLDWVVPAATVILGVLLIVVARSMRSQPDDEPTEA